MKIRFLLVVVCLLGRPEGLHYTPGRSAGLQAHDQAGVTSDRILHADGESQNWLTYSGGYSSQRYSLLTQITRENVKSLTLKWVWRPKYLDKMETTPLVVDGVLYTVQNSEVVALDAVTTPSELVMDASLPTPFVAPSQTNELTRVPVVSLNLRPRPS